MCQSYVSNSQIQIHISTSAHTSKWFTVGVYVSCLAPKFNLDGWLATWLANLDGWLASFGWLADWLWRTGSSWLADSGWLTLAGWLILAGGWLWLAGWLVRFGWLIDSLWLVDCPPAHLHACPTLDFLSFNHFSNSLSSSCLWGEIMGF